MVFKRLLIFCLLIVHASSEGPQEGKRLLKFHIGEPAKWVTKDEMKKLLGDQAFGFMDLTRKGSDETSGGGAQGRNLVEPKYPDHLLHKDLVQKLFPTLKKDRLKSSVEKLSSFHSRHSRAYFGPKEAEGWLSQEIKSILADYKGGFSSVYFVGDPFLGKKDNQYWSYTQKNIIALLEGHDSTLKEDIVILTAHYDSIIGFYDDDWDEFKTQPSPGADDNGSGCSVLLEILRVIVDSGIKFKHTIQFHFYTAKETGMEGALDVVTKFKKEGATKIKGLLNLDRIGFGTEMGIVDKNENVNTSRETSEGLTAYVKFLGREYLQPEFQLKDIDCQKGCFSDNMPWHLEGFPTAFLQEYAMNKNIHSERDTIEHVNFDLVNEYAKLSLAFLIELGDGEGKQRHETSSGIKLGLGIGWSSLGISFGCIWLPHIFQL